MSILSKILSILIGRRFKWLSEFYKSNFMFSFLPIILIVKTPKVDGYFLEIGFLNFYYRYTIEFIK